ncbi:MAG: alanine--tRNA ligase, partial [Bacteroidota bacterium]
LFAPYIQFLEQEYGCKYGRSEEETIAIRVVMDHIRAVSFSIADGQMPSNTGAGYVIRRILRRASRYGFQFLGRNTPFLYRLVDVLSDIYKDVFPEIVEQRDFIRRLVEEEEKSFLRTLSHGTKLFEEYLANNAGGDKEIDGRFAFKLYDTYGFPKDLTIVMATEKGWTLDDLGFASAMQEQKDRSSADAQKATGDWVEVKAMEGMPVFTGYEGTSGTVNIVRHRTLTTSKGNEYQVVLNETPFYAESGGQIGDTGTLTKGEEVVKILDTQKENDLIVHFVDRLPSDASGDWAAEVDGERRRLIVANHSATHLMHAALREVLGTHVEQRGSYVGPDALRFDFSHFQKTTPEEIAKVEAIVNARIAESIVLGEHRDVPIDEAKAMGAMALFGEKYGEQVRVIVFNPEFSVELCGGIHVANTSAIRLFKITSEGSIQAGVRRIEAVTSDRAVAYFQERLGLLNQLQGLLRNPQDPARVLGQLLEENKKLEKELKKARQASVGDLKGSLSAKVQDLGGFKLLSEVVEVPSAQELKSLVFDMKKSLGAGSVIVLGADLDGKAMLNIAVSDDLANEGKAHAGNLVREIAPLIQGGGGKPQFAQAG